LERTQKNLFVVGAGTMGAGIAQVAAVSGWAVRLADVKLEFVERGLAGIGKNLDRLVEKGRLDRLLRDQVCARVQSHVLTDDATDEAWRSIEGADLVIEAIVEDLEIKQRLFSRLAETAPAACVLATNTSSLSVGKIAEAVRDPGRVVGMHFFNPAPLMPLVEIISGRATRAACADFAFEAAKGWGKTAVRAKDTPGFIVNRVARGFYLEALRLLGEGVAGIDEIDNVMRLHGGFKMGPFELMDLVGLDVNLAVSTSVWEQMGRHPRFAPHEIQRKLVGGGHLGRKTNRGFFGYKDGHTLPAVPVDRRSYSVAPLLGDAMRAFCDRAGFAKAGPTEQLVFCRILTAVLNEAALALDDEVASREDIDIAMLKGTNYPKGPLAWIEEIGPRNVRGVLKGFCDAYGDGRYAAARLLAEC
jgi:3-hydroxybutyryl-CoA dehydrogenase